MKKILVFILACLSVFCYSQTASYKVYASSLDTLSVIYNKPTGIEQVKISGDWSYVFEMTSTIIYIDVLNITNKYRFNVQAIVNDSIVLPSWRGNYSAFVYSRYIKK